MFQRIGKTQIRDVTTKEAEAFLKLNTFQGQRPLNQLKARQYADLMEKRLMRPVDIAVMTMPNGIKHLANGQHVCTAIVLYGKPFPARIDYYRAETEHDAWMLFGTFDVHASRTEQHILKAAQGLFSNNKLRDVPLRVLQSCGSALFYLEAGGGKPLFSGRPPTRTTKAELVERNAEEVLWASFMIGASHTNGTSTPLTRVGVITAMMATARANTKQAQVFWEKVKTGELLTQNEPAYKLRQLLTRPSYSLGGVRGGNTMNMMQYVACISWWNSFRTGEPRSSVKLAAIKELPEVAA